MKSDEISKQQKEELRVEKAKLVDDFVMPIGVDKKSDKYIAARARIVEINGLLGLGAQLATKEQLEDAARGAKELAKRREEKKRAKKFALNKV